MELPKLELFNSSDFRSVTKMELFKLELFNSSDVRSVTKWNHPNKITPTSVAVILS